jgi:DNA polymerase III epsilon subunit-like protein
MKLLIFDTETTGLPQSRDLARTKPNNWPHIVSISWVILDTETNYIVKQRSAIIHPEGRWIIPEDSIKIHGITNDIAIEQGEELRLVMEEFIAEKYDYLVAHNMQFDLNVINNALIWDLGMKAPLFSKRMCTMVMTTPLCKLPGNFGKYKSPKLKELYFHAFGRHPDESRLHGSMYDVHILTELIQHYKPLREAMGLVRPSVIQPTNGIRKVRSIEFKLDEAN